MRSPKKQRTPNRKDRAGRIWSVRCRLFGTAVFVLGNLPGKRLAVRPNCAIRKLLLFPNGHRPLEGVDQITTGIKGGSSMRRGDRDHHAGLANGKAAQAMHDASLSYGKLRQRLVDQALHLLESHLFVSFVIEKKGAAAAAVVPYYAFENHHGAIGRAFDFLEKRGGVDSLAGDFDP